MIVASKGKNACIFQINKVARGLGLRKIQDFLQISDAHFTVRKNQVENAQTRFIGTSLKNL